MGLVRNSVGAWRERLGVSIRAEMSGSADVEVPFCSEGASVFGSVWPFGCGERSGVVFASVCGSDLGAGRGDLFVVDFPMIDLIRSGTWSGWTFSIIVHEGSRKQSAPSSLSQSPC